MSYDDQSTEHDPDRGAYTPPTDDDLPFRRAASTRAQPVRGGASPCP